MNTRNISVDYLARVEGEGALYVELDGERIEDLKFKIFEPPRFFEAFLRGRSYSEAPDITARICGICPVAYQTSAVNAMENAFGASVSGEIRQLRRLLYCAEWIESHALHIYFLHAPDFLGYESGIAMAADYPDLVKRGLRLKKIGNELLEVIGGRAIHPVNSKVGGFYRAPRAAELAALISDLEWAREASIETARWVSRFTFPQFEVDYEFVALHRSDEYAVVDGRIRSNRGIDIDPSEWGEVFEEQHVEWSNALHARVKERGAFHVGPLARLNLSYELLTESARRVADQIRLRPDCRNPFQSIMVRAVELIQACEDALQIIDSYRPAVPPAVDVEVRAGEGFGVSEAPRGLCLHRYLIDDDGLISEAQIVPPTSQNQKQIEEDLRALIPERLSLDDDVLKWRLEQAIRNYDPCISCATHFLDLEIRRK